MQYGEPNSIQIRKTNDLEQDGDDWNFWGFTKGPENPDYSMVGRDFI